MTQPSKESEVMPQYRDEPLDAFERHWLCPKKRCSGEMKGTGYGITTMYTSWLNRCNKCGHEQWADISFPQTIFRKRKS